MATTFNWVITAMDCVPQTAEGANYVITAHWSCNGVDGQYANNVYSTCSFASTQADPFIPYDDLTQDTVLGWCWANGVDKDATEATVQQQIDNQINPPVVSPPLPWAPAPAPAPVE